MDDLTKQQIRDAYFRLIEQKSLSPRWGQRQMVAEVAKALARMDDPTASGSAVCVVEAGTGTGKTIAYAVAAIPVALALGKKLVVSTATIALQEQFVNKDLPDIRKHSGLDFDFVLAKGRRRYVCLSRLDKELAGSAQEQSLIPLYPDEFDQADSAAALPYYNAMLDALGRGEWDGDRDNWDTEIPEDVWFGATTDHRQCSGRRCPNIGQCSFYRARDALQNADVIVTNHDLVLSDLALGGGAILSAPEETVYVFDEGHHLADKALNHFSGYCRVTASVQWTEECRKQLRQGASLASCTSVTSVLDNLPRLFEDVGGALEQAGQLLDELIDPEQLSGFADRQHYRFPEGVVPDPLRQVAGTLVALYQKLLAQLQRLERAMEDGMDGDVTGLEKADAENWYTVFGAMLSRAEGSLALWQEYDVDAAMEDPPHARWINLIEAGQGISYELRSSPILAADILREHLWDRAAAVVATSATMTALNSFERFILHSGAPEDSVFKVVPSPFDYSNATLRVPAMACDPSDPAAHTEALIALMPDLFVEFPGTLVLFSSRRQMHEVYEGLAGGWAKTILVQGDYSKQETLRRHREAIDQGRSSIIFGLASFAEGVDLPGDYCSHVIIAKIPFAVPDTPLESALAEWVEARGGNSFMELSVPDAALKLVQASGRLLRTEQDSGVVTILDRRLVTRRYGKAILDSLPAFKREIA
ncbi:ATP-dependent DNA helicase DinG [Halieaceae bacterium IMCC14734]|uniref:ATP-dependent DNA helicase DinG n=1 Tax=Candidatus Litorirhabdus singularis TaxID=2518993 RepID=A0ABT3TAS7_9GAMM|nr:ATP-dependent DNA helicase DinG [Candidatus Litorirhabdus singularis]